MGKGIRLNPLTPVWAGAHDLELELELELELKSGFGRQPKISSQSGDKRLGIITGGFLRRVTAGLQINVGIA